MNIRRLTPADAEDYRALMLAAYKAHASAFTSTLAERAPLPLRWWEARLAEQSDAEMVLGAFAHDALVGVTGLRFQTRERLRHKATLFGMAVRPAFARRGIGRALVQAALDAAARHDGIHLVQLTVTEGNVAALALYEACGFERFGSEPDAVAGPAGFLVKRHLWRRVGVTTVL